MRKKFLSSIKPLLKSLLALGLVIGLAFAHADGALAARTGGRIGGGSFSAPSRSYSAPRTYAPGGGYSYYPGGGFGFPLIMPFFWGGGGLFSILIFLAVASFLSQAFRRATIESGEFGGYEKATVSIDKVQVGLLAEARNLKAELDALAERADTGSPAGRAQVLQEVSLALLRHPEYWYYGAAESQQLALPSAEAKFYQAALTERSKFVEESLSNYNNLLRGAESKKSLPTTGGNLTVSDAPSEYIVVTLLAATEGKMQLPKINSSDDLRQALRQIGSVDSHRLRAIEILWTPQASGDTLTAEDVVAEYPNLKLV